MLLQRKSELTFDKLIAFLILFAGIIAIGLSIRMGYNSVLPPIAFIAALLYLLFRARLSRVESPPTFLEHNRIRLLSNIIFTIAISLSIWLVWSDLYYRPPLYFALCLLAAAAVILYIFCLDTRKNSHLFIALFMIILLSLTIYGGKYYQFPGFYGTDPWIHSNIIQQVVNDGRIPLFQDASPGIGYYPFPIFHILAATTQILTSINIHDAVFISVDWNVALSCIFVFFIGRKLANAKVGLLAALLGSLADVSIKQGTEIIPNSLGFFFFSIILYLFFCRNRRTSADHFLIIILTISLILTHSVSAFITLLVLIVAFICIRLYKTINKSTVEYNLVNPGLIVVFIIFMLFWWMRNPPGPNAFFDFQIKELVSSLQTEAQFVMIASPAASSVPYYISLLDQGGYLVLLFFGFIGGLIYLHIRNRDASRMALIAVTAILAAVIYGFNSFGLRNILPWRWFQFLYVPLSILAVQGIFNVSNLLKGSIRQLSMVMVVMLLIIFMMISNSLANDDSPLLFNNTQRYGFTQSEITAVHTLSDMQCGNYGTDLYYGEIFPFIIGPANYSNMILRKNAVFILRNYYIHHPEWNEKAMIRIYHVDAFRWKQVLVSDYLKEIRLDKDPLIYNNGNVKTYLSLGSGY